MSVKNTISITEARKRIFDITDQVVKTSTHFTLTEKGRPKAVLMSAEEFESWQETLEIMSDAELMKDIEAARKDIESGAYKKYPTLEEVLAKEGFVLADNSNKKYVSSGNKKSSAKKPSRNRSKV